MVTLPRAAGDVAAALEERGIIAGLPLEGNRLLVTATEMTRDEDIHAFVRALGEIL